MSHTLIVTAVEAKNLLAADRGGTSDPYCKLRVGSQNFKTKIVKKCLAPKWNETFTFKVADPRSATLIIEVLDHDTFSSDDPLGSISIPLNKLERGIETTTWHNLSGVPKGQINIRLKAIDFGVEPGSNAAPMGGAGAGPVGYQSQSQLPQQPPMGGGYPSQGGYPPMGQPPMGGAGYPPNPYASQPPMGGAGYPPNPYGPPQPMGGGGYPPNPYGYPPDPYNSGGQPQMGGGYPPNPYGPPMGAPYGSQLPPPGAYPPQGAPGPYGSQLPPNQPGFPPGQQPPPGQFPPGYPPQGQPGPQH